MSKRAEVLFEAELVEIDAGGFEEAVLEVVEVEHDVRLVHLRLGIADGEVKVLSAENLQAWQQGDGAAQQFFLLLAVVSARLTSVLQGVEEGARAEVLLQIAALIC